MMRFSTELLLSRQPEITSILELQNLDPCSIADGTIHDLLVGQPMFFDKENLVQLQVTNSLVMFQQWYSVFTNIYHIINPYVVNQ